jgi:hypothetical protein
VGLSLNPDGLEDHEIKIKGLENIKVGDFSQKEAELESGLGSLTATDIAAVEAAQVKLAAKVVKSKGKKTAIDNLSDAITEEIDHVEEGNEDEEEPEEVFTLGRMNTRSQTQVSQYFTAEEIEQDEETIRVYIDSTDDDEDDVEPEYDPSSDDDDFDQALHGD